jgi:hypothetical protein
MAVGELIFYLNFRGWVWSQAADYILLTFGANKIQKSAPNGQYNPQRDATPDRTTQQNSLQRVGGPYRQ